jgi:hypothetical protein
MDPKSFVLRDAVLMPFLSSKVKVCLIILRHQHLNDTENAGNQTLRWKIRELFFDCIRRISRRMRPTTTSESLKPRGRCVLYCLGKVRKEEV